MPGEAGRRDAKPGAANDAGLRLRFRPQNAIISLRVVARRMEQVTMRVASRWGVILAGGLQFFYLEGRFKDLALTFGPLLA